MREGEREVREEERGRRGGEGGREGEGEARDPRTKLSSRAHLSH